jgi:hypothetical protein
VNRDACEEAFAVVRAFLVGASIGQRDAVARYVGADRVMADHAETTAQVFDAAVRLLDAERERARGGR